MSQTESETARKAFASPEWRNASESLFHATGITVSIVDFQAAELMCGDRLCAYCLQPSVNPADPAECFDSMPSANAGVGRVVCRAGLPALYAPLTSSAGSTVAHVMVGGFVSSTRERRGRYEYLLSRGVAEDTARKALRGLPVVSRREADAYLQVALSSARTILNAALDRDKASSTGATDMRSFVTAGRHLMAAERLGESALDVFAEHAASIVGGEAAAILRRSGSALEVVAHSVNWRGAAGALVSAQGTVAGRALQTGRAATTPPGSASPALAMPLSSGEQTLGVLEVRLKPGKITSEKLAQLNQFGRSIALSLEREDERRVVQRAMDGFGRMSELATALAAQTDVDGVVATVSRVMRDALPFSAAGLILTGWGSDRVELMLVDGVPDEQRDYVLGVVAGREVSQEPFALVRATTLENDGAEQSGEWAVSAVELGYGDLDVGWLFAARRDGGHYDAQDRALLEGIAAHAGAALGRAALFSRVRDDYAATVAALSAALDTGADRQVSPHAGRIMEYAVAIGEQMGLGREQVEQLRFAGLLHDMGTTGLAKQVLVQPASLSPEELVAAQRRVESGATLIDQIDFLTALTPVILHHHEHWDGSGYPHALAGETIPVLARVLAVADAFDTLTAKGAGRKGLTVSGARKAIEKDAGTVFDPRTVEALGRVLDAQAAAGMTGLLNADTTAQPRPQLFS